MSAALLIALASLASPGLSARLVPVRAVEGEPVPVVVEVTDAAGVVGGVRVEVRTSSDTWVAAEAERDEAPGRWRAELAAGLVPRAGRELALRASILGARGGLLLDLGFDEPMTVTVASAEAARTQDRVLRQASTRQGGPLDRLVAYVGLEGRAGSGARARVVVAVGIALSSTQELTLGVAVGPAFARPAALAEGGPLVLGVESAWRVFTDEPRFATWAPFFELGVSADARLPGFDPGLAARVGFSVDLGLDTRLDLAVGGGPVVFAADTAAELGFVGGGRLTLRFGGSTEARTP